VNPRADRGNRTVLTLLGLLFTAAGAMGLALSYGAFGTDRARRRVLTPSVRDFAQRNHGWFWLVVAAAAVILALLALRWLAAQLGSDRVGALALERDTRAGATTLQAGAVTSAVTEEVESYRGVRRASARFVGNPVNPDLVLTVTADERADLGVLRDRIEQQAIPHTRQATGRDTLPVILRLHLASGGGRRVR